MSERDAGGCKAAADCAEGNVCVDGTCVKLCSVQADCPDGYVCTTDNLCAQSQPGAGLPEIASVIGNHATDPGRVTDGLVVLGNNLDPAVFEIATATAAYPLAVRSRTATRAEVVLPVDVRSGPYTLVATNLAGSDQASVTLELPELDGDTLLTRINGASGRLVVGRMPIANDLMTHLNTGTTPLAPALLPEHTHAFPLAYGMENLIVQLDPDTANTVRVNAAHAVVLDPTTTNDLMTIRVGVTLTATLSTTGPGGLDTGTPTNSTWYYIWLIYNPSTDAKAVLLSASFLYTGVTRPTGYTHLARLGAVRRSAGGNLVPFYQSGKHVTQQYIQATSISSSTESTIDLSPFVPVNAVSTVYGWLECDPTQPTYYTAGVIYGKVGSYELGRQHITAPHIDGPGGGNPEHFPTRVGFTMTVPPNAVLFGRVLEAVGPVAGPVAFGVHISGYDVW